MEARDFIYHFTDILFSEIVKSTILTENWTEADFDYRYIEYADIFIKMKDSYLTSCQTDEVILDMLSNSRKKTINLYNDKMRSNFEKELKKNGVNDFLFDQILPADILTEDSVNVQSLEKFRCFEERTFTKKPVNEA